MNHIYLINFRWWGESRVSQDAIGEGHFVRNGQLLTTQEDVRKYIILVLCNHNFISVRNVQS
jgi:hypothetical protein